MKARTLIIIIGAGLGFIRAAIAADDPCSREGLPTDPYIDLAQIRCQNGFWQHQIGVLSSDLISSRAAAAVARGDLEAAKAHAAQVDAWWRAYVKGMTNPANAPKEAAPVPPAPTVNPPAPFIPVPPAPVTNPAKQE